MAQRGETVRTIAAAARVLIVMTAVCGTAAAAAAQTLQVVPQRAPTTGVTLYPILGAFPLFGFQVDVPPSAGGGPGGSGSTGVSLNAAYGFGVSVESRRWLVDASGLWAAVAGSQSRPLTTVDSDITFVNAMAGIRIANRLFAVAGVKRIGARLDVSVTEPSTTSILSGRTNAVAWDPMIGAAMRGRLTDRTQFEVMLKGGGFGVGTDVDVSAAAAIDWHVWRRLMLRVGYSFVYYRWTMDDTNVDAIERTLVSKQTLHGPEFGLGIRF